MFGDNDPVVGGTLATFGQNDSVVGKVNFGKSDPIVSVPQQLNPTKLGVIPTLTQGLDQATTQKIDPVVNAIMQLGGKIWPFPHLATMTANTNPHPRVVSGSPESFTLGGVGLTLADSTIGGMQYQPNREIVSDEMVTEKLTPLGELYNKIASLVNNPHLPIMGKTEDLKSAAETPWEIGRASCRERV